MSTPNADPFDKTVWDPRNPEQAAEDPFHGPEARLKLLSIPPFPNEDGTYYVFGGSYVCGTNTFDVEGRPFIIIGSGPSFRQLQRDTTEHMEWIKKWFDGELPPFAEMGYPVFQLDAVPYLVVEKTPVSLDSGTVNPGIPALDMFPMPKGELVRR